MAASRGSLSSLSVIQRERGGLQESEESEAQAAREKQYQYRVRSTEYRVSPSALRWPSSDIDGMQKDARRYLDPWASPSSGRVPSHGYLLRRVGCAVNGGTLRKSPRKSVHGVISGSHQEPGRAKSKELASAAAAMSLVLPTNVETSKPFTWSTVTNSSDCPLVHRRALDLSPIPRLLRTVTNMLSTARGSIDQNLVANGRVAGGSGTSKCPATTITNTRVAGAACGVQAR